MHTNVCEVLLWRFENRFSNKNFCWSTCAFMMRLARDVMMPRDAKRGFSSKSSSDMSIALASRQHRDHHNWRTWDLRKWVQQRELPLFKAYTFKRINILCLMQCYVKVANDVTFRFRNFEHKSCPSAVRTVALYVLDAKFIDKLN